MNKWIIPSSLTMAVVVSFCLFAFMASLIKPVTKVDGPIDAPPAEVMFAVAKQTLETPKVRKVPPKMAKATPPPPTQVIEVQDQTTKATSGVKLPGLELGGGINIDYGTGGGPTLLSKQGQNSPDSLATPIIQITPQYPIDAARKGIEGWVKLSFSIDTDGTVTNVQILDSSPKRTFDRAARKALKGWRYKAKFVNATPVMQHNLQVQLDFELEK
jgi:protein TonB